MVEAIQQFFDKTFSNPYIATILISMLPIIELRGGIPYGYVKLKAMGMGTFSALSQSYLTAFIGSSLVVPFLLLLLIPIINLLKKAKFFRGFAEWLERHFHKKSMKLEEKANRETENIDEAVKQKRINRIKYIGVYIFTAIPLPLTGVWSASAVAAFLKLDFKKSMLMILLGNLTAGLIMCVLSALFGSFFGIAI